MMPEFRVRCAMCIISIVSCVSVEREIVLLFKTAARHADRQFGAENVRAKNRDARLERRRQDAVFVSDLGKLAAQKMEKFADRVGTASYRAG